MAPRWTSFTATPIYNQPALCFSTTNTGIPSSGMQFEVITRDSHGVIISDQFFTYPQVLIPLHITKISAQNEGSQVGEVTYGPIIDLQSNLASGGTAVNLGPSQLPKIALEGFIDTPMQGGLYTPGQNTSNQLSSITVNGMYMTYGEILAAFYEGRQSTSSSGYWQRSRPLWFRDSYGRVYTNPTIYDLTIQKLETVPHRETFTIQLMVA